MNFGQLTTLVLSWLDDPQGAYFTPSQTAAWINNAQREAQKQLLQAGENYYVEKMSGQTIANQATYVLPSDFRLCHKMEMVCSGTGVSEIRTELDFVTYQQLEQISQSTGFPVAYNLRRNIIEFRPIPDNIYTMYLHQSYRVVDMSNATDVPDIPQDYHEYIAVLATLDGFLKDQRDPSAFVAAKEDKYLQRMVKDAESRDVSAPRTVVVTEGFGGGYLF